MKKLFTILILLGVTAFGQFNTPTIDGTIAAGEYGIHTNGNNQQTNGSQTWFMTWDETNLYVGISGSTNSEGAIIYLDKNPIIPINGGTNTDGTLVGFNYDGSSFAELQFRSDLVVYAKDGYREYRTADGSNGWSTQTSGFGAYSTTGGAKEFSIPWSAIGGKPTSFAWFGYVAYVGGGAYGEVPLENNVGGAGRVIGDAARYVRYFTVSSTTDLSSTKPFSRNSYVFNSATDVTNFGVFSAYNFTMNSSGKSVTRSSGGSNAWTISGNLIVGNGTVDFGSATTGATISGNVQINSGGTLKLSSAVGGDLNVAGDFTNNGTFDCNNRSVQFNGTSPQTIYGTGTTFNYFDLNSSGGVSLSSDIAIVNQLTLNDGKLTLGSNSATLNASSTVSGTPSSSKMIVATGSGKLKKMYSASGSFTFPVGDAAKYTPVTLNFTSGTFDGTTYADVNLTASAHPNRNIENSNYLKRYWTIGSNVTTPICEVTLKYDDVDVTGSEAAYVVGRWTGTTWSNPTHVSRDATANTIVASTTGFSDFTGGEAGALPVELTSFNAAIRNGLVDLKWETATEVNNYGFEVERKTASADWSKIGFVEGHGSTNSPKYYSYSDKPEGTGKIAYRLKQIDNDGQFEYSPEVEVLVDNLPNGFVLEQNYPNPFNPETSIRFALKEDTKATLKVYNSLGAEIATLFDGTAEAGRYYDVKFGGSELASGFYIYKLVAGEYVSVKKMLLMK